MLAVVLALHEMTTLHEKALHEKTLHEKLARPSAFAGRHLDVAMADCTLAMMEPRIAEALTEQTSADALFRPGYGVYLTADARYVSIGALEDHFWQRLVRALELDELSGAEFAGYQQRRRHIGRSSARCASASPAMTRRR